ncbi:hypothetical protein [Vannielia litorea]|uniref:hypothetical protein n=1 Tax=Vannielia litorea TaxID=1217970 RepID=UPI001BCB76B6|nr:hypothetical protein [Vannielia litorea]MBS8228174.1 hypothetical protein [Vannielia litorea]
MMRKILAMIPAALMATDALADDRPSVGEPGYKHYMLEAFTAKPCGEALAHIDKMDQALLTAILELPDDASTESVMSVVKPFMDMTMAFGMILGFEAGHPNIRSPAATPLERLRADCASWPGMTAWELLERMAKR